MKRVTKPQNLIQRTAPPTGEMGAIDLFPAGVLSRKAGPLYRQVTDILRAPIVAGTLPPGAVLPREADLSKHFGVSLITVRLALRDLETEGLILKRTAKPAVVAELRPNTRTASDYQSLAAIVASTEGLRLEILSYRKKISERACEVFGLASREPTHCLQAILHVDKGPVTYATFYFAPSVGNRLRRADFDDVVVFRSVQRHLGVRLKGARISVRGEVADADLAALLDYKVGGAIVVVEILYFSATGEPVELTINKHRADLFSLNFDIPNDLSGL